MQSFALALALLAVPDPKLAAPRPVVEVAFVLDTTGSMGGLIDGAKLSPAAHQQAGNAFLAAAQLLGDGADRRVQRIA